MNKLFEKGDRGVFNFAVASSSIFPIELIAQLLIVFEGVVAAAVDRGIIREMIDRVEFYARFRQILNFNDFLLTFI